MARPRGAFARPELPSVEPVLIGSREVIVVGSSLFHLDTDSAERLRIAVQRVDAEPSVFEPVENVSVGLFVGGDIVLPHATVAREHVELQCADGEWWVRDLESHCGIYIDLHRQPGRARLRPGQQLHVGQMVGTLVP
jgi:hypothetical protein